MFKGLEKLSTKYNNSYTPIFEETSIDVSVKVGEAEEATNEVTEASNDVEDDIAETVEATDDIEQLVSTMSYMKNHSCDKATYAYFINKDNCLTNMNQMIPSYENYNEFTDKETIINEIHNLIVPHSKTISAMTASTKNKLGILSKKLSNAAFKWDTAIQASMYHVENNGISKNVTGPSYESMLKACEGLKNLITNCTVSKFSSHIVSGKEGYKINPWFTETQMKKIVLSGKEKLSSKVTPEQMVVLGSRIRENCLLMNKASSVLSNLNKIDVNKKTPLSFKEINEAYIVAENSLMTAMQTLVNICRAYTKVCKG